jgi:hypothetical protein
MAQETTSSSAADAASEIFVLLGQDSQNSQNPQNPKDPKQLQGHGPVSLEALRARPREQLLDFARRLGLTGVAKAAKDALATRVYDVLVEIQRTTAQGLAHTPANDTPGPFPGKFDLGPDVEKEPLPQHIPWSYGQNRVTGMVVDPDKMFVYWECTDAAIENARRGLGAGGRDAWLNLRVYDITGRLFDGTNAHSYFDHKLERWDRQWFFVINKPTSVACIELGLRSSEGFFVKIVRSGRVEFPRREPLPSSHVEWLTVWTATGDAGTPVPGAPGPGPGPGPGNGGGFGAQREMHGVPEWANGGGGAGPGGAPQGQFERRWEWTEHGGVRETWQSELASIEWVGPVIRSAWEAGPFTYPVQSPAYVEEWNEGAMTVRSSNGRVHIVYGPWQVVIRGINAHAERRVLATWEMRRSWSTVVGVERTGTVEGRVGPGGSEWVAGGASERMWMGGSEMRLGGASELYLVGASEMRLGGASETMYAGASEWMMRGASERMFAGASEWRWAGASENLYGGASERLLGGASERLLGGASERRYEGGGSEARLGAYPESLGSGDNPEPPVYPVKR